MNQEYRIAEIDSIRPHPRNPRRGDVAAIQESIEENGWFGAIVVQKSTGLILAGNHSHQAAKERGMSAVPIIEVDVDDDTATKILLADNRTSDLAVYDNVVLSDLLKEIQKSDRGLNGTAFDDASLEALLASLSMEAPPASKNLEDIEAKPALADELQKTWKVKTGDIWACGNHRIICGDSTNHKTFVRLMDGELGDLIVTDPPYGVNVNEGALQAGRNRRKDGLLLENDDLTGDALYGFLAKWLDANVRVMKPGSPFYIAHADFTSQIFRLAISATKDISLRQVIIWVKDSLVFGRQDYHWRHDPILYGWKAGAAHYFDGGRSQDTVWEIPRPKQSKEHPTMKPVSLFARMVRNSCPPGGIVVDAFLGS